MTRLWLTHVTDIENNDLSAHQGRGGGHVGADLSPVLGDLQGGEVRADLLQHHRGLRGEAHAHTERVVENIAQPELSSIESVTKNDVLTLSHKDSSLHHCKEVPSWL